MTKKQKILLAIVGVAFLCGLVFWLRGSGSVVDPNKDKGLNPDDGFAYAALYKHDELYTAIDENDEVLRLVQEDMLTFARKTVPELSDTSTRVGFTFEEGTSKDGEASVYRGRYYGSESVVEIRLTPHGKGVFTLSIVNAEDGKNVDSSLKLNGKRNAYIRTLPVEKTYYSIRYQLVEDRIVVTFYDGYSAVDIDEVAISINQNLGDSSDDVIYSINRVGIVSLEDVRKNLTTPLPRP